MFIRTFHQHFMVECIIFLLLFNLIVFTNEVSRRRKFTKNRIQTKSFFIEENKKSSEFLKFLPSNEVLLTDESLTYNESNSETIKNGFSTEHLNQISLIQHQNLIKKFANCTERYSNKSSNKLKDSLVFDKIFLNLKTGNSLTNEKLWSKNCLGNSCINKLNKKSIEKYLQKVKFENNNSTNSSINSSTNISTNNSINSSTNRSTINSDLNAQLVRFKRQIFDKNSVNNLTIELNLKNESTDGQNDQELWSNTTDLTDQSNDYQLIHKSKQSNKESSSPNDGNFPLPVILKLTNSCKTYSRNHKTVVLCAGEIFKDVPEILSNVNSLTLYQTAITVLKSNSLSKHVNLTNLYLENNKYLHTIENDAFKHLTQLQTITIKQAPLLKIVDPAVIANCPSQISLFIYRSGLEKAIKIEHNKDKRLVSHLQLDNNKIRRIESFTFKVYVDFMSMDYNLLENIEANAFNDSHIGHLSLKGNYRLTSVSEFAFQNLHTLRTLDLSDTSIISLPVDGLKNLETLRIMRTYSLKKFPSVLLDLPSIKTAHLTYPYHCCAFKYPRIQDPAAYDGFEKVMKRFCNKNQTSTTTTTSSPFGSGWGDGTYNKEEEGVFFQENGTDYVPKDFIKYCGRLTREETKSIICQPVPDAFNPCEDIMGNNWLRITVWLVLIAALFGNLSVFVILFTGKLPINVSKFLMCNLAIADFSMGVYLLIIAVTDLRTMGEYFNYAIDWQHGLGCQVAGFLTVFSSELSIYTLTVITMERYFPIAYPLQINKRLKLSFAFKIMLAGWLYAAIMAALPLPFLGISSYSKTSICLPMETRNMFDYAYLVFILVFSAVDFVLICVCYAKMYLSIISQKTRASHNDMKVAKGMAMLVFTDFVCFMPITFFGLTSIAGYPLIDVTNSKYLLVFFFPINAIFNPFLYACLTKQLRRDFYLLAARFGLCSNKPFRPTACTHLAYYRYYHHRHRHNEKCLATIGSTVNSKSSSNCQSMLAAGYNCNATNTSNSYSASQSQLSNSMLDESYLNEGCSLDNPKKHGRILRYYYRNPYPHHHFSFSKQYKEPPSMEPCCNKYKRKEHEKHVHCYHHHHHKKHPHSAPVSQVNESFSIGVESNSENSANKSATKTNLLDTNKYLNNALSTSLLYSNNNPNVSSCSSSNDHCSLNKGTHHSKCATDSNKVCTNCSTNKKSMIKCLTLFKSNYLFHHQDHLHNNDLHNRTNLHHHQNEIGSLTTGTTTYDSTFTTNNNPTALTQLSTDSNILNNNHIEIRKMEKLNELDQDKIMNFSTTTITQATAIQCEQDKKVDQLTTRNEQIVDVGRSKHTKSFKNLLGSKMKLSSNETNKKQAKKLKPIKFKFKLTTSKQIKTNDFELKKLKNVKTVNGQEKETKLLRPRKNNSSARLEINQMNMKPQLPVLQENSLSAKNRNSFKDSFNKKQNDDSTERLDNSKELINHHLGDQINNGMKDEQKKKSIILEDLMDNQIRTKPTILKKWIMSSRKKCDYNCHTNFKLIKNEVQLDSQPAVCKSNSESNEINNNRISNSKENEEQIKKKLSVCLLPAGKTGYNNNNKETLFTRLFRSLTSSSSTNSNNPSGNTSDSMQNSASNGCLNSANQNDKLDVNKSDEMDKNLNSKPKFVSSDKTLDRNEKGNSISKFNKSSDLKELNLSLNSLETSPQKLKN